MPPADRPPASPGEPTDEAAEVVARLRALLRNWHYGLDSSQRERDAELAHALDALVRAAPHLRGRSSRSSPRGGDVLRSKLERKGSTMIRYEGCVEDADGDVVESAVLSEKTVAAARRAADQYARQLSASLRVVVEKVKFAGDEGEREYLEDVYTVQGGGVSETP